MSVCICDEWMIVVVVCLFGNDSVCFVGIGLFSVVCNLVCFIYVLEIVLIYEFGIIGMWLDVLLLLIGDGELVEIVVCVVLLLEIFSYYLQVGCVDVGFFGVVQIDCFGNFNSIVIGLYELLFMWLLGGGGVLEIVLYVRQVFVMVCVILCSFVEWLDFCSSVGFFDGYGVCVCVGFFGGGLCVVIIDFGMFVLYLESEELQLVVLFEGVIVDEVCVVVGWLLFVVDCFDIINLFSVYEFDILCVFNVCICEVYVCFVYIFF